VPNYLLERELRVLSSGARAPGGDTP
jgi:hypothetical protein